MQLFEGPFTSTKSCEILHELPTKEKKQNPSPTTSAQPGQRCQLNQQAPYQHRGKRSAYKHIENISPPPPLPAACSHSSSLSHRRRRGHANRHRGTKEQNHPDKDEKIKSVHIASVDDYDLGDKKGEQEQYQQYQQPVKELNLHSSLQSFPFVTYDPGLLDTAVIMITTSRTQSVHVCFKTM